MRITIQSRENRENFSAREVNEILDTLREYCDITIRDSNILDIEIISYDPIGETDIIGMTYIKSAILRLRELMRPERHVGQIIYTLSWKESPLNYPLNYPPDDIMKAKVLDYNGKSKLFTVKEVDTSQPRYGHTYLEDIYEDLQTAKDYLF